MGEPVARCLCGALPIIDEAEGGCLGRLYKYHCPNCIQKELPWLGQWDTLGALQEWNRIALKKSYRKRTLEYNEHGVCIAEPSMVIEWRAKKGIDHRTVNIYEDNGRFYYCYDYFFKNGGSACGLWIGDTGYPTVELLKANAKKHLKEHLKKSVEGMKLVDKLIQEMVQNELF